MKKTITIIGRETILSADSFDNDIVKFYTDFFEQLGELEFAPEKPVEIIGFQAQIDNRKTYQILGISLGENSVKPAVFPQNWLGLSKKDSEICQISLSGMHKKAMPRVKISPCWEETLSMVDFTAKPFTEFQQNICAGAGQTLKFETVVRFYTDPAKKADDAVELVEPDAKWVQDYQNMRNWFCAQLPALKNARIEHYGSTAIGGIPAKPVVDMLIEVPSFTWAREHILPVVDTPDWEYWLYGDHMILIKRCEFMGKRTHHVHLATPNHRLWEGLAFRDYLIEHPKIAQEYADLKRKLAGEFTNDREKYTISKTEFIQKINKLATPDRDSE